MWTSTTSGKMTIVVKLLNVGKLYYYHPFSLHRPIPKTQETCFTYLRAHAKQELANKNRVRPT